MSDQQAPQVIAVGSHAAPAAWNWPESHVGLWEPAEGTAENPGDCPEGWALYVSHDAVKSMIDEAVREAVLPRKKERKRLQSKIDRLEAARNKRANRSTYSPSYVGRMPNGVDADALLEWVNEHRNRCGRSPMGVEAYAKWGITIPAYESVLTRMRRAGKLDPINGQEPQ